MVHTHTHTHTHTHRGILFSHKMKEILPCVTTQIKLEGILLSETSQRKTNTVWPYLYVESTKTELRKREQIGDCQGHGSGVREMNEGRQRVQINSGM